MTTHGTFVENALGATETTETNLGTITMPSGAKKRIVGVWGIINGIQTTAEYISGYFRLEFGKLGGDFKFPAQSLASGAGTLAGGAVAMEPRIIPVNIEVEANETIKPYVATWQAQTGACRSAVGVLYDD